MTKMTLSSHAMRLNFLLLLVSFYSTSVFSSIGSDWLISNANVNGSINSITAVNQDYAATVETLITLDVLGESDQVEIANGLQYLQINISDDSVNLALTLLAQNQVGIVHQETLDELQSRVQTDGGFSPFRDYQSSLLDTIFALSALVKTNRQSDLIPAMVEYIASAQQIDGGFKLKLDEQSSIYVSSQASLALQLVRGQFDVSSELTGVTQYLLSQRNATDSWDSNWQTALALLAIINVNTDQAQYQTGIDELNTAQLANGSWDNDVYTTALALRIQAIISGTIFVPPANPSTIFATVIDESNNQIINLVNVEINTIPLRQTQSAANGEFNFNNLNAGTYQLSLSAIGYQNRTIDINVLDSQILDLGNMELFRLTNKGILQGIITDAVTTQPLENTIINVTGSNTLSLQSNLQGLYIAELDSGDINIEVSLTGYETINATATVVAGQILNFSPAMSITGTAPSALTQLFGQVINAKTSLPLENTEITLSTGATVLTDMITDINGLFSFADITPEPIEITINKAGFNSVIINTGLVAGIIDLGEIGLTEIAQATTVTLSGTITGSQTNLPIQGASVLNSSTGIIVQTDTNGFYEIENIKDLEFDLTTTKTDYFSKTIHLSVSDFGQVEQNYTLTPIAPSELEILSMISDRDIYYSNEEVEIELILKNSSTTDIGTRLYIKVINELGEVLEDEPVKHIPIGGNPADAIEIVPDNNQLEIEVPWFTRFQPAGDYTIIISAKEELGGNTHDEDSIVITILPSRSVGGLVEFDPPVMQFDPSKQINLTATISNTGNLPTGDFDITAKVYLTAKAENPPDNAVVSTVILNPFTESTEHGMDKTSDGKILIANDKIILMYDPTTNIYSEFSSGFASARDVSVNNFGLIYVLDISKRTIVELDVNGDEIQVFNLGINSLKKIEALANGKVLFNSTTGLYELNTQTGIIRTIAKNNLNDAEGIVVTDNGDIYVADEANGSIFKFDGIELTLFVEELSRPHGLTLDADGSLLVTEWGAGKLSRIDLLGNITIITEGIDNPFDVKVALNGSYYVSSFVDHSIYEVFSNGTKQKIVSETINKPTVIVYDHDGNNYIYNSGSRKISKHNVDGSIEHLSTVFTTALDLLIDQNNQLLVASENKIFRQNNTGEFDVVATAEQSFSKMSLTNTVDELTVIDGKKVRTINLNNSQATEIEFNNRILSNFTSSVNGIEILYHGPTGFYSEIDSNNAIDQSNIKFHYPVSFAKDSNGNKYIAEQYSKKIFKVDTLDNVTEFAQLTRVAYKLITLPNGNIVYGDGSSKLYINDGTTETEYAQLPVVVKANSKMFMDDFGIIWISSGGYNGGIVKINTSDLSIEHFTLNVNTTTIRYYYGLTGDGLGGVYLGSYGKVYHFDGVTTSEILLPEVPNNFIINNITFQNENLWLADSYGKTIFITDLNGSLIKRTSINGALYDVLYEDSNILVSTDQHVLNFSSGINNLPDVLLSGWYTRLESYDIDTLVLLQNTGNVFSFNKNTSTLTDLLTDRKSTNVAIYNNQIKSVQNSQNKIVDFDINANISDSYTGIVNPKGIAVSTNGDMFNISTYGIMKIRPDGYGDFISQNYNSNYLQTSNDKLYITQGSRVYIIDQTSGVREFIFPSPAFSGFKGLSFASNGDFVLSSNQGLVQVKSDGTATKLVSTLNKIVDMDSKNDGSIHIGISQANSTDIFLLSELDSVSNLPYSLNLPGSLNSFALVSDDIYLSYNSNRNSIYHIDSTGKVENFPYAFSDHTISKNIIAYDSNTLYATEQIGAKNRILKLDFVDNNETGLQVGELIFNTTLSQGNLEVNSSPVELNIADIQLPIAGSYTVELTTDMADVSFNLTNTVSASALASGNVYLAQQEVFPGNVSVETNVSLESIDAKSVVEIRTDQFTEITNSNIYFRNFVANDEGDFYGIVSGQLRKINHIDGVEETLSFHENLRDIRINNLAEIYVLGANTNNIYQISNLGEVLKTIESGGETFYLFEIDQTGDFYAYRPSRGIYKLSSTLEWQFLFTWSGGVRYFEIGDTGNIYISDGLKIHQISQDGTQRQTILEDFRMENEAYNMEVMCFDNLMFTPMTIDVFPSIRGEEHTLIHFDPKFGIPRLLFDAEALGIGIIDNDSMHYDRFNNRILLSTDYSRYGIFSIPVYCGSMTVETHIITRPDVDISLNGDTPTPQSIIENSDGSKEYIWKFEDVGVDATNLPLTASFNNLLEGETRPVFAQAYLQFKNTLVQDQDLQVPLDIPTVHASSAKDLGLVLDNIQYPSDTDVNISDTVTNNSGVSFSGMISQHIETEQGVFVDSISDVYVSNLAASAQVSLPALWNTAYYFAGNYKVVSQLLDENGIEQDLQEQAFSILPDEINGSIASLTILADKQMYNSIDDVVLSTTVANIASNAVLENTSVQVLLSQPDGMIVFQNTSSVNNLSPNASQIWQHQVDFNNVPTGSYLATLNLIDENNVIISSAITIFEVVRDDQQFISGNVTTQSSHVDTFTDNICTYTLNNTDIEPINNIEVHQLLVNLVTQETILDDVLTVSLSDNESWTNEQFIETFDLSTNAYACILRTVIEGSDQTRATAVFNVIGFNHLTGIIWDDNNANGLQDSGELVIENAQLRILDNNQNEIEVINTSADGSYEFTPIANGEYTIEVLESGNLTGYVLTTTNSPVTFSLSDNNVVYNFGYQSHNSSITGIVFADDNGNGIKDIDEEYLENITVSLDDENRLQINSTSTDNLGQYSFTQLLASTYQITVSDELLLLNESDLTTVNQPYQTTLIANQEDNANFGYQYHDAIINGFVFDDANSDGIQNNNELALANVSIELSSNSQTQSTLTDASGFYQFSQLIANDYQTTVTDSLGVLNGYQLTTANQPYAAALSNHQINASGIFGYQANNSVITGKVFKDDNGNGIQEGTESNYANVTLSIVGANISTQVVTDGAGTYELTQLPTGNYTVTVTDQNNVLANTQLTSANQPYQLILVANQTDSNGIFAYQLRNSVFAGIVFVDSNGNGIQDNAEIGQAGVSISLTQNSLTIESSITASDGSYGFNSLVAGDYQLDITDIANLLNGTELTTNNQPLTLTLTENDNQQAINFGYQYRNSSIAGIVFDDANENSLYDTGEVLFTGIVVELRDEHNQLISSIQTDTNGHYEFVQLIAGTYQVAVTDTELTTNWENTSANNPASLTLDISDDQIIDFAFSLVIRVDLTQLETDGRGRILILLDTPTNVIDSNSCGGIHAWTMQKDITSVMSEDTEITARLYDSDGQLLETENVLFSEFNSNVDDQITTQNANLIIQNIAFGNISVRVTTTDVDEYATLNDDYSIEIQLDTISESILWSSNQVVATCETTQNVGDQSGDFDISGLFTAPLPPTDDPYGPDDAPTLIQQKVFLRNLLDNAGWTYTITENANDFQTEFNTDQYVLYAIFSEEVKLPTAFQYDVTDALATGEGLLIATGHDDRNHKLYGPMGVKLQGKHPSANSMLLDDSALHTKTQVDLSLDEMVLKVSMIGATSVGRFTGVTGNVNATNAMSHVDYGLGKGVFGALDLLIQATHLEKISVFSDLILNSLSYIHNEVVSGQIGKAQLVRLDLANLGIEFSGVLEFTLPQDVSLSLSNINYTQINDTIRLEFALSEGENLELNLWFVLNQSPKSLTFEVFDPDEQIIESLDITLTATEAQ